MARVAAPGRRERLPAHAPLRTVRESFPSHGSSLSKNLPVGEVPAIVGSNVSIQAWRAHPDFERRAPTVLPLQTGLRESGTLLRFARRLLGRSGRWLSRSGRLLARSGTLLRRSGRLLS